MCVTNLYSLSSNVLSFYRSKIILDHPNCFGRLQIVLVGSKRFWLSPNHFGQVQIRLLWTNFYNLDLTKMIWNRPKRIGPVLNNWYWTKMIWTVQNYFGFIGGQDISVPDYVHWKICSNNQDLSLTNEVDHGMSRR